MTVIPTGPIEIREQPTGSHISIARKPVLTYVELDEDVAAGDTDKSASELDRDGGNAWQSDDRVIDTVVDPQSGTYLEGERHVCLYHAHSGSYIPVSGVQWHLGKADQNIPIGDSGKVLIWKISSGGDHEESAQKVTAFDWFETGAKRGASVLVYQQLQSRRWYFVTLPSGGLAGSCISLEARLGSTSSGTAFSGTAAKIEYDEVAINHGSAFQLSTSGATKGEVSVGASGLVEVYLHGAASAASGASGSISQWWVEHKKKGGSYVAIEDSKTLLHHPAIGSGQETGFIKKQLNVAHGDTLRVMAQRVAGSDSLQADSLSGGGPTSYFGVHFLCPGDTHDYEPELTETGGDGTTLRLDGYYELDESGGDRLNGSGSLLKIDDIGGTSTGYGTGQNGNSLQLDSLNNELSSSYTGASSLRPASERFNIAFWINVNDVTNGDPTGFQQIIGLAGITGWQVHLDKTQGIRWRVTGPGLTLTATDYTALETDKWYFVVGKVDGPNQIISIRVRAADYSLDQTHTATGPTSYGWDTPPGSFAYTLTNTAATWYMNFQLDDIGIWSDHILTPGQEDFLFGAGRGRLLL